MVVLLEDTASPVAGLMDSRYRAIGELYEREMHQVVTEYFGDPLAFDQELDGGGRILMLFSPKVNDFGRVNGFVWFGDFYPRSHCAGSNESQIFYAIVPTDPVPGFGSGTIDGWYRAIRSTVIHEVKHITSGAERFSRGALFMEESWLEESTARIAEEIWGRGVFGYKQGGATKYSESLYCEVRPQWPECGDPPLIMWKHFGALADFMEETNHLSPLGRIDESDWSFYGSGWSLVRWVIDHFAASEREFLRALIGESESSGVVNLVERAGADFAEILVPWSLSLYWPYATGPHLSHPSWDLHDIFGGLHGDFPDLFPSSYPLMGWKMESPSFTLDVGRLSGGSSALIVLEGESSGTQLLGLTGYGGGGVGSRWIRIAVLRID